MLSVATSRRSSFFPKVGRVAKVKLGVMPSSGRRRKITGQKLIQCSSRVSIYDVSAPSLRRRPSNNDGREDGSSSRNFIDAGLAPVTDRADHTPCFTLSSSVARRRLAHNRRRVAWQRDNIFDRRAFCGATSSTASDNKNVVAFTEFMSSSRWWQELQTSHADFSIPNPLKYAQLPTALTS